MPQDENPPPAGDETADTEMTRRASVAALAVAMAGLLPARPAGAQPPGTRGAAPASESHRRSPAASVTSVHGKLRHIVMADEDYGLVPGGPAAANAQALQRAVDDAQVIMLPNGTDVTEFAEAIRIPPYTQLTGAGPARTVLRATGPLGFVYQAPGGMGNQEGPKFAEFTLQCAGGGIRLNRAAARFVDGVDSQQVIQRARIERVEVHGPGANVAGSIGIEWNKVFSGIISQCEIVSFKTGVKTLGCDFPAIVDRTRIWLCGTLVQCESSGTFGSGMLIDGADLLLPTDRFIRSSDRHLIVRGSYFEKQGGVGAPLTGPALDIAHAYMTAFTGNRFETPARDCPAFLSVTGDGTLFVFENNSYAGEAWGRVRWNDGAGARYMFNPSIRQRIVARGNKEAIPVPFNSNDGEAPRNERRDLWVLGPDTPGFVSPFNFSGLCRVQDGAFVLPAGPGSLIRFKDTQRPVSGLINIHVLARSDVAGTRISINPLSGESGGTAATLTLGRAFQWQAAFERLQRDDLAIDIFNPASASRGSAFIKAIVVERA